MTFCGSLFSELLGEHGDIQVVRASDSRWRVCVLGQDTVTSLQLYEPCPEKSNN